MKSLTRSARGFTFAAVLVAAAMTVSGCISNPIEDIVAQKAKEAIKDTTGIDVVADGTTIPDDFPLAGKIVDGNVTQATALSMGGLKTWSVTLEVGDAASAFVKGKEGLVVAGYEEIFALEEADGGVSSWNGPEYSVIFNVTTSDGKSIADYVVSQVE